MTCDKRQQIAVSALIQGALVFLLIVPGGVALACLRLAILFRAFGAALVLGTLVVTGVVQVWMILGLSFVTGCCMSIAGPSYLALVFDLVGREDLANAIALNSTQFQLSRALGPVCAALGFKLFGLAGCFFANGISFAAVVISLAMDRYDQHRPAKTATDRSLKDRRAFIDDLVEGFRYVAHRPRVRMLLIISAATSMFG